MQRHIDGYSLALLSLATEEKKLKQYKEQSLLIYNSLKEVDDYEHFMESKSVSKDMKKEMLTKAFKKKLNKNLFNFLLLLVDRNKFVVCKPALLKLIKLIDIKLDIHEGIIYTPVKLTPKEIKDIEKKLEKELKIKPTLINKIDVELVSGFKIYIDDELIEDNVFSRLEDIRNQLLGKDK
ncbi:MAG: ATP synthase F1 subunit delta [Mycoplasmataceae bacterium]|nr:ATP synthase F1 subunit delta [Mycoplasmataceae bacterium]